jgi:hypothetical protein
VNNLPQNGLNFPAVEVSPADAALAITTLTAAFVGMALIAPNWDGAWRKPFFILTALSICAGSWLLAALQPLPSPGIGFVATCVILILALVGHAITVGVVARSRGRHPLRWGASCLASCVFNFALGAVASGWIYQAASHGGKHVPWPVVTLAVAEIPFLVMVVTGALFLAWLLRQRPHLR